MIGYTYKKIPKFYLTFASGISLSAGKVSDFSLNHVGLPLHIEASYFFGKASGFAKDIGINFTIIDIIGSGKVGDIER